MHRSANGHRESRLHAGVARRLHRPAAAGDQERAAGDEWSTPLILLLLLTFAVGAVLGMIACLPPIVRQRREIAGLRKEMDLREHEQHKRPEVQPPPMPDIPVV